MLVGEEDNRHPEAVPGSPPRPCTEAPSGRGGPAGRAAHGRKVDTILGGTQGDPLQLAGSKGKRVEVVQATEVTLHRLAQGELPAHGGVELAPDAAGRDVSR